MTCKRQFLLQTLKRLLKVGSTDITHIYTHTLHRTLMLDSIFNAGPTLTDGRRFQWQLNKGSSWENIDNDHVIEINYCLPHAKGITLYNTPYGYGFGAGVPKSSPRGPYPSQEFCPTRLLKLSPGRNVFLPGWTENPAGLGPQGQDFSTPGLEHPCLADLTAGWRLNALECFFL